MNSLFVFSIESLVFFEQKSKRAKSDFPTLVISPLLLSFWDHGRLLYSFLMKRHGQLRARMTYTMF